MKNTAILREDYAILSHVMKMALDSGKLSALEGVNDMKGMKKWFDDALLPNLKTVNVCYDETGCWSGTEKTLNGQKGDINSSARGCGLKTISFTLYNGSAICYDDFSVSELYNNFGVNSEVRSLVFYIDVNGTQLPNVYGKDIFLLIYDTEEDVLVTAGSDKAVEDVEKDCSIIGTGRFCSTYAKRNNWTLPVFGN